MDLHAHAKVPVTSILSANQLKIVRTLGFQEHGSGELALVEVPSVSQPFKMEDIYDKTV